MDAKIAGDNLHSARQPKVALVLDGGGAPGALYEIGVLTALDDSFGSSFSSTDFDFVDGAVGSRLSVDIAVDHGADLVLNINPFVPIENDRSRVCLPTTRGHCARITEKGVGWVASQAFRLLSAGRKSAALQQHAQGTEAEVYVIEPHGFETTMFMRNVMDFGARSEILNYGYHSGVRFFQERGTELHTALRQHGISLPLSPDLPTTVSKSPESHGTQREKPARIPEKIGEP